MRRFTLLALPLVLLAGCLDREEIITVAPDGEVTIEVKLHSRDAGDLYEGDAVPTLGGGWLTEAWTELDDENEEHFHLRAEQAFGPGQDLPASFADAESGERDVVLHFPTERIIEARRDGTYMHFRRVYPGRAWAHLATPRQQMEAEVRKVIGDRDFKQLTLNERQRVLVFLAKYELLKYTTFARRAFLDVGEDVPQDVWLDVRAALQPLTAEVDLVRIAELLGADDERAGEAIEQESARFEEAAARTLRTVLDESGRFPGRQIGRFFERFEHHKRTFEITEDLGDDAFTIRVRMPGAIVGHNGDSVKGNEVTWSFGGGMMRDREIELMVTTRLR